MREQGASRLVPVPTEGRVFRARRRVRFGDVSPAGRARLDAVARYLQDVSNDDTVDAGLADDVAWVVRRAVVEVGQPAVFREELELATFCSGTGSRWAERRVSITGSQGARIEAATVWVHVDATSGRPVALDEEFGRLYAPTAAGREVTARLTLPTDPPPAASARAWPLRFCDFDALGHVNNALAWAMVEEAVATEPALRAPHRVAVEYRQPIGRDAPVELCWAPEPLPAAGLVLWAVAAGEAAVVARVEAAPKRAAAQAVGSLT